MKTFKQTDINEVARLTYRNAHTNALIHIARSMDNKCAVKTLQLINKMHDKTGYMPKVLMEMRNEVYEELMKDVMKYSNGQDMHNAL